jgi:hypothetical protein
MVILKWFVNEYVMSVYEVYRRGTEIGMCFRGNEPSNM